MRSFDVVRLALPLAVGLTLVLAGCGQAAEPDAGAREGGLPDGNGNGDAGWSSDGGRTSDGAVDGGTALSCGDAAAERGWSFCGGDGAQCSLVFEDGTGCVAACRALGLHCVESYEDAPGACDYQRDLPALRCAETGHTSDYCVCGTGVTPDVDAGSGGSDAGVAVDAGGGAPHEALLNELIGFGEGTTGGAGGPIVEVTNLNDAGPDSLRAAATAPGRAWIRFRVSGTITLSSPIDIASDKTIDGRGADITIAGGGLFVQNGRGNVILNNLRIRDAPNDLIRFYNVGSHMWVHHCSLSNGGDGAFDATEGVTAITISYTHIFDHDKAMLVGAGSDDGDGAGMRWTAHHNWYENVIQRLPFIRFGRAHSFNNLYEWYGGTAMSARLSPAQILVENSIFAPQTSVGHKLIGNEADRGAARLVGNLERPRPGDMIEYTEYMPGAVFDPHAYYSYTPEPADDALIARLRDSAGWQDVPFPE